jgi:hypothetical protein
MEPKTEELLSILNDLEGLLRSRDDAHWASWIGTSARTMHSGDLAGVRHLLSVYWEMGSFSDVVLDPTHGEAANKELSRLRSRAWELADDLRRNAVVTG